MTDSIHTTKPANRLTVSTLGAPGESLDTVLSLLAAHGITGIELRLSLGEIASPAMGRRERTAHRSRITDAGVYITGLASYIRIADPGVPDDVVVGALASALEFAADLEAPTVRVFPGAPTIGASYRRVPATTFPREECDATAVRRLNAVARLSRELGVHPVLETHDSHPRGEDIAAILEQVDGPVGAVWDLMHPWRVGEPLETTWHFLHQWLDHGAGSIQVKDANVPESRTPVPLGQGSLPVHDLATLLHRNDYDGILCLEWEKAWHPTAPPLQVAVASLLTWHGAHWDTETLPAAGQQDHLSTAKTS